MTLAPSTAATVPTAFLDTVARTPDAVALRGEQLTLTWAELAQRVAEAAGALNAHGVRAGDTVATLLTNRPEQWIAHWKRIERPETIALQGMQLPTWWHAKE